MEKVNEIVWEYVEQYKFFKVYCLEGHYMTDWTDDRTDYENYSDAKTMFTGSDADKDKYRCITEEEHERYNKLHDEAIQKQDEERRAKEESERQ